MVDIVSRGAEQLARETQDELEARDVQGLAFLAVAGATGVILAQEVTERVLPMIIDTAKPQSATGFAVAGGVKVVLAIVLGAIAANMGGAAMAFIAFMGLGSVVFAGADFVNAVQQTGLLAENAQGSQGSDTKNRRRRSQADGQKAPAGGGGDSYNY